MHAARVAARIRRDLGTPVDMVHGRYGQFLVQVDGKVVVDGGALAALGVLPSLKKTLTAVREALGTDKPAA